MIEKFEKSLLDSPCSWENAKLLIDALEKEKGIKKIDDFIVGYFEGEKRNNVKKYKNKTLVSTALLAFVWNRVHRAAFYDKSIAGTYFPLEAQIKKIEGILSRAVGVCGDDCPLYKAAKFIINCLRLEYDKAYELMSDVQYPKDGYMYYYFKGLYSFFPCSDFDLRLSSVNYFNFNCLENKLDLPVFIVSCDKKYYDEFYLEFLNSARNSGINNTICFFVIGNFSDVKYFPDRNYYVIHVKSDLEVSPVYYASARYLYALEIIKIKNYSVFVFDIDFSFARLGPQDFLLSESVDISLSFNKYGRSFVPWSYISAASSYFSGSDASLFFLKCFSSYFNSNYSPQRWWIDQNSLFFSFEKTKRFFPDAAFKNIIEIRDLGCTNSNEVVIGFKKDNYTR